MGCCISKNGYCCGFFCCCPAAEPPQPTPAGDGKDVDELGEAVPEHGTADTFSYRDEALRALHDEGCESSRVIFAVNFGKSNAKNGRYTWGDRNLHDAGSDAASHGLSAYEHALQAYFELARELDPDRSVELLAFGDVAGTRDAEDEERLTLTPMAESGGRATDTDSLSTQYRRYRDAVAQGDLWGSPCSFEPAIRYATSVASRSVAAAAGGAGGAGMATHGGRRAHVTLVIFTDSQSARREEDRAAIVDASREPVSIILVGVGDGGKASNDWKYMRRYLDNGEGEDSLWAARAFDNVNFAPFDLRAIVAAGDDDAAVHRERAKQVLRGIQELAAQHKAVLELGHFRPRTVGEAEKAEEAARLFMMARVRPQPMFIEVRVE